MLIELDDDVAELIHVRTLMILDDDGRDRRVDHGRSVDSISGMQFGEIENIGLGHAIACVDENFPTADPGIGCGPTWAALLSRSGSSAFVPGLCARPNSLILFPSLNP